MRNEKKQNWFVLCTKARKELDVLDRLQKIGIQAYTPTKTNIRIWSDRKKKVKICLLPSMVLVKIDKREVNKVFDVPGVKKYLFFNGVRAVVFNHEVNDMKNYLENKFKLQEQSEIDVGNYIDIPGMRQRAEVLAIKGKKCFVKLQMLGATMSLKLS